MQRQKRKDLLSSGQECFRHRRREHRIHTFAEGPKPVGQVPRSALAPRIATCERSHSFSQVGVPSLTWAVFSSRVLAVTTGNQR